MTPAERILAPYRDRISSFDTAASQLDTFVRLLLHWTKTHNLVSRETLSTVWDRHIGDSLQLLPLLPDHAKTAADLGSGGGFPAVPLAIVRPDISFTLVEPAGKKAAFLRHVARELGLSLTVDTQRAEAGDSRETVDLVTSRALTALTPLLAMAQPFSTLDTVLLLHKGRGFRGELDDAAAHFHFDMVIHQSRVDPEGVVLEITRLCSI